MFNPHLKSTGRDYSMTVALLAAALIFVPVVLIATRSFGYFSLSLAAFCSALCLTIAWVNWTSYSRLAIPSLENGQPVKKYKR